MPAAMKTGPKRTAGMEMVARLRWPRTNEELVSQYDEMVDLFGQRAGDGFLEMCKREAQRRGFLDRNGHRRRPR